MKRTILFVDATAPSSYDPSTLLTKASGGTESSLVRVAEGLAATGLFNVIVEIHNRTDNVQFGALYCKPETAEHADYVVSLRYPQLIPLMQKRFKNAKHYCWNHDLLTPNIAEMFVGLSDFTAVAVSNYHKTQMQCALGPQGYTGQFPIQVVYNAIDNDLAPDDTPVDRNKLVFFSSPHKSLDYTLALFSNLRNFNPDFRLYVANPGYLDSPSLKDEGVVVVGSLPQREALKHVRSSLCVFYPAVNWHETFGLVYAEANAVGTPVIAHPNGSAREVLYHPSETLDCHNVRSVIDRVMAWHSGNRPKVKATPKFRLSAVIQSWMRLFNV